MGKLLWKPSQERVNRSKMMAFISYVNEKYGRNFSTYTELYQWSVNEVEGFWDSVWSFMDIKCSLPYTSVVDDLNKFPGAKWFVGAKLNYAENMLRFCHREGTAIVFRGEDKIRREYSYKCIYNQVTSLASALRRDGVKPGDRVAGYMPNIAETIIAMLATAAVGAVWCSCATDIGPMAAIDRIGQVKPKIMITADAYYYKGKKFDVLTNAEKVCQGIDSIERVIVAHYAGDGSCGSIKNAVKWDNYLVDNVADSFQFEQMDASSPMLVMFSSGTTGKPKCMVQSIGGILINQLKELVIHSDIHEGETLLYITTCSWMMWNWQAAALGTGAKIVLFDGNPSYPDASAIWKVVEEEGVTAFGISASYIHSLMIQGFVPKDEADLDKLKTISQTGSALSDEGFEYIYSCIKKDLHFNSIAGGTDINGCFATGIPIMPVYSGQLQAPGLGMKIECLDYYGKPVRDVQGELVCLCPAPSMPLYFWDDEDNQRYNSAYFDVYPRIWKHGDYVMFHSDTGGITFYGRSDSVLKPSGVRIGTAEIYNQVDKLPQIQDSLAIGQNYWGDQRIILFVMTKDGIRLDEELKQEIKDILRENASPRHVPAVIIQVPDIPRTLNGKKVESAVTNIINGRKVTNRDALENPDSLEFYQSILLQLQN